MSDEQPDARAEDTPPPPAGAGHAEPDPSSRGYAEAGLGESESGEVESGAPESGAPESGAAEPSGDEFAGAEPSGHEFAGAEPGVSGAAEPGAPPPGEPGAAGPGHGGPEAGGPGYAPPGYAGPGAAGPGYAGPGYAGPGFGGRPAAGPGFAGRHGFVRPTHGRYLAGVCAGVGRATNTDPILWRVLVVVLTLFGGIGLLVYLLAWLVMPGEGDTASPVEALLGRGDSNTSAATVILVAIAAILTFIFVFSDTFHVAVLAVLAALVALLVYQRGNPIAPPPPVAPPTPPAPPPTGWPGAPVTAPPAPYAPYAPPPGAGRLTVPPARPSAPPYEPPYGPPYGPPPAAPQAYGTGGYPLAAPYQPAPAQPTPYRPPFAPYGPYGGGPPPAPPAAAPRPPKPPRERSKLGRIVLSMMCLVIGALIAIDVTVGSVRPSVYVAAPLVVVALGLVVGAWVGRARGLIALGIVLTVALGAVSLGESDRVPSIRKGRPIVWHPTSVAELSTPFSEDFADATLDLRDIDFTGTTDPVIVHASVDVGRLTVLLPLNVDADITGNIEVGDARVLGTQWGGIDTAQHRVQDNGVDGPGGGKLILDARVDGGSLEVKR